MNTLKKIFQAEPNDNRPTFSMRNWSLMAAADGILTAALLLLLTFSKKTVTFLSTPSVPMVILIGVLVLAAIVFFICMFRILIKYKTEMPDELTREHELKANNLASGVMVILAGFLILIISATEWSFTIQSKQLPTLILSFCLLRWGIKNAFYAILEKPVANDEEE